MRPTTRSRNFQLNTRTGRWGPGTRRAGIWSRIRLRSKLIAERPEWMGGGGAPSLRKPPGLQSWPRSGASALRSAPVTQPTARDSGRNGRLLEDLANHGPRAVALSFANKSPAYDAMGQHGQGQPLHVVGDDEGPRFQKGQALHGPEQHDSSPRADSQVKFLVGPRGSDDVEHVGIDRGMHLH